MYWEGLEVLQLLAGLVTLLTCMSEDTQDKMTVSPCQTQHWVGEGMENKPTRWAS